MLGALLWGSLIALCHLSASLSLSLSQGNTLILANRLQNVQVPLAVVLSVAAS